MVIRNADDVYMNVLNLDRKTGVHTLTKFEMKLIWNKQCITILEIKDIRCKLHENFKWYF